MLLTAILAVLCFEILPVAGAAQPPLARTRNGTYSGTHSSTYGTDFFLGIPFARPPTGSLRLQRPASLNTAWAGIRQATSYGPGCIGSLADSTTSEDCLTLNVVRPSGFSGQKLPVGVWIYGGGWSNGASNDPRFNLTWIVRQSVAINKPIIAVSINYRLSAYGWLWSTDVVNKGVANLGLRDQRLALHWLQENIAAFGGDPSKVTIWGESAGGVSVGNHLLAYNGRNDGLFRGAISESGPLGLGLLSTSEGQC